MCKEILFIEAASVFLDGDYFYEERREREDEREMLIDITAFWKKHGEDTCLIIFLKKQEVKIFQIKMKYKGRSQDRYRSDFLKKISKWFVF